MPSKAKAVSRGFESALSRALAKQGKASCKRAQSKNVRKSLLAQSTNSKSHTTTLKRPAAAHTSDAVSEDHVVLLKRPAVASTQEEHVDNDEDQTVVKDTSTLEAREAVRDVRKQQRLIVKLTAENERWLERVKHNKGLLRKAEKQLDVLKDEAEKKTRILCDKTRRAFRRKMEGKANRAKDKSERITQKLQVLKKRYNKMRAAASKGKGKVGDVESMYKKAQQTYDAAKKECVRLKKDGEDVPEEGEKNLSAPGAYKPPGARAAKARDVAKEQLAKARVAWEKTAAPANAKQDRLQALKEKMKQLQQEQEKMDESIKAAKKFGK